MERKGVCMELIMMSPDDITKNDWNPNVMEQDRIKLLETNIQRAGFLVPVVVRKVDKNYEIVDGEHRWKAAQNLGLKQIPVVVATVDEWEAKLQTINLNNIRGELDQFKLAKLLEGLRSHYSDLELEEILGYTPEQLGNYQHLLDFDFNQYKDYSPEGEVTKLQTISFVLNDEQAEIVNKALNRIISTEEAEGNETTKEKALELLCGNFLADPNYSDLEEEEDPADKF